jgi:hypothetical protein
VSFDENNPPIMSTQKQLAFWFWQVKRNYFHTDGLDLAETGESWDAFNAWWGGVSSPASLRDLCLDAWQKAMTINEPNHGSLHHFEALWSKIVEDGRALAGGAP